ncbi:sulfotransferase [Paraburkholderia mimosarum]|uniref:sulfotransferase n=1 Tax=Paraburkholderia mimosarum TaxID=312026 RepID=UPI0006841A93|nr:sulfotransferase [Paraburkholderia mimosarum]
MTHFMPTTQPFVILGMPRTGTHYLEELLNAHPNVLSNGELLNTYDTNWPDNRLKYSNREILELAYLRYPVRKGKAHATHIGCKINQPQFLERTGFFDQLAQWPRLKAMLVVRRNTLESLRSLVQARQSGEWLKYGSDNGSAPPPQVALTIELCEAYFKAADDFHRQVVDSFAPENLLSIEYENLLHDPAECMEAVQTFLGISVHPCSPRTALQRQEVRPLEQTVLNFDELKGHFSGGQYERFFEKTRDGLSRDRMIHGGPGSFP